ncbi:MAG: zinc ribbon domain-containing protein [Methanomassiliicoccus sp.]|nr:zinc ribbon domain-containing protein [Methanomassiliicoccus sp.]
MIVPTETLILIVVVIISAAVAFLELRFVRDRRRTKIDAAVEKDDAYNAVTTTRAVAMSLRQNGRDTTEGDVLIYQAESAYGRGEFLNATELAGRARKTLMTCKEKDLMSMPAPSVRKCEEESTEVPATRISKMPANYLESKFIIDTVEGMVPQAPDGVREEAETCLARARSCFDGEEYTAALAEALKAKRVLAPAERSRRTAPSEVIRLSPPARTESAAEKAPAGGSEPRMSCPSCHVEVRPDDAFCRKCGTRIGG